MYRIFCPACSPSGPLYLTVWPFRVCWSVPTWTFFTLNSSGSGFFGCPEDCGALWPLVLPSSWIWFCSLWSWTLGGVFWLRTSSPKSQSPSVAMTQQRKHCEVMTLWHDLGVSEKVSWILEQQVLLGLKDYKGLKLEKSLISKMSNSQKPRHALFSPPDVTLLLRASQRWWRKHGPNPSWTRCYGSKDRGIMMWYSKWNHWCRCLIAHWFSPTFCSEVRSTICTDAGSILQRLKLTFSSSCCSSHLMIFTQSQGYTHGWFIYLFWIVPYCSFLLLLLLYSYSCNLN